MKKTKLKIFETMCILSVSLFLTLVFAGVGYSQSPIKLSLASTVPDSGFNKTAIDFLVNKVAEFSKGKVVIQKFLGGSLGGIFESLELSGVGEIDIVFASLGPSRYAPGYDPTVINFYFPDSDSILRYWSPANPIYDTIQKTLYDSGKLRHLASLNMGTRAMTSNKPVFGPDDFKGIKMRVPNIVEYIEAWKELGCMVTPLPGSEIFGALQTGVIDAQENTLVNIVGRSMWEVQKFVIFTGHNRMAFHFTISAVTWEKLSKENQQAVEKAARLTATEMNKVINELEAGYIQTLRDKGMILIYPDTKAIRKAARPAVDRLLTKLKPGVPEAAEKAIRGEK